MKKIRALVWDITAHQGTRSRLGPIREATELKQCQKDVKYLEAHCNQANINESKVILEGDPNWNGPKDTIFNVNPNP